MQVIVAQLGWAYLETPSAFKELYPDGNSNQEEILKVLVKGIKEGRNRRFWQRLLTLLRGHRKFGDPGLRGNF